MKTRKINFMLFFFFLLVAKSYSQGKEILYYKLRKGHYYKSYQIIDATVPVKRKLAIYNFGLPCSCIGGGSIGFYWTADTMLFKPNSIMSDRQIKKLKYIDFEDLVVLLKKDDLLFNKKFILYFIEPGKKNMVYHVHKLSSFSDDEVDRF